MGINVIIQSDIDLLKWTTLQKIANPLFGDGLFWIGSFPLN